MYPGMMYWWKRRHAGGDWGTRAARASAARGGCGSAIGAGGWEGPFASAEGTGDLGSGVFGVRRPLRFLAFKLRLSEAQVTELARILSELKTERAQAEVDRRRTVAAFADAIAGETLDEASIAEGAALRVASAERLRDAVLKALRRIHALLDAEQRSRLAYLIRTGALQI